MSVNGKRKGITREDLLEVARQMNIKKAEAIIDRINKVISRWPEYAEKTSVNTELTKAIQSTFSA